MATAIIQSSVSPVTSPTTGIPRPTLDGVSRDDLVLLDEVTTTSVNVGTSYAWSIAFKPQGATATVFSSTGTVSAVNRNPGAFDVGTDGPYLIRLAYTTPQITLNTVLSAGVTFTINGVLLTAVAAARTPGSNDFSVSSGTIAGISAEMVAAINDAANGFVGINLAATDASPSVIVNPTVETVPDGETVSITYSSTSSDVTIGDYTTEQYVRLRALTSFAGLKLVAAGERYDTLRVPVDATASGWADEQNFNLLALLGVANTTAASTRVLYVDPVNGDYQTIQAAMDYAHSQVPAPTDTEQWIVLVRPGIYVEALTFYPWVNLFGWPGGEGTPLVCVRNSTGVSQTIALANASHTLTVVNVYFQQVAASAVPTLSQSGSGEARFLRCSLQAQGNGGEAYRGVGGVVRFVETEVHGGTITPTDYAISLLAGSGSLTMHRCKVTGRSGILLGDQTQAEIRDSHIHGSGDFGISTNAASLEVEYCEIRNSTTSVAFNPGLGGTAGNATTTIRWSRVGDLTADGTNVGGGGVGRLDLGSTEHGTITRTNGAVGVATVPADTIFYDNALVAHSRIVNAVEIGGDLTATNVQDALDEIYTYAIGVRTLDDAYDGGITATGVGRTIVADQGAVQIVDAVAPSDPIPPDNPNGSLEVVGAIKVGGINKPEISVDPNPFGNGPAVHLGREIWAADAPSGSTALILGDATGDPMYHNYNLRVGTQHADGGAPHGVGELFLRAGDSHGAIDAGSLYIQAGTATLAGGEGGDIYVVPGGSTLGATEGSIILGRPSTATSATLTANAAMGVGTATAGIIQFATDMGSFKITLVGGESLAAVHALFNATGVVTTAPADDPIILTTVSAGPTAEVFFLNADPGVDASIGTFAGQAMVAGTWPDTVKMDVTGLNEITIGAGGAAGALVYNSETGKLTVPGAIDPTGMIFSESTLAAITNNTVAGWTGTNEGGLFVSDGTGGLLDNHLYYVHADGVTTVDLTGGGTGDVVGPAGVAADNAVVRWDGLTGKIIQDSSALLDDAGTLSLLAALNVGTSIGITHTASPPGVVAGQGSLWVSAVSGTGFISGSGVLQALPGAWQTAVIHSEQLAIKSQQGMILQATAFWLTAQPVNGDLFTITDGTTTRTYGAVAGGDASYPLGATVADTLNNLAQTIVADALNGHPWTAKNVGSIDFAASTSNGVLLIHRVTQTSASFPDRIYGGASFIANAAPRYMRFDEAPDYRAIGEESFSDEPLPAVDPAAKRFGPGRQSSDLLGGDVCVGILDQSVQILNKTTAPDSWDPVGGGDLATTLALGNTSGGTDVQLSTGDELTGQTDVVLRSGAAAGTKIELYPSNTGAIHLQGRTSVPDDTFIHFGASDEAGIAYFPAQSMFAVGSPAPTPASVAPGTIPDKIGVFTRPVTTTAVGVGAESGAITLESGNTDQSGPGLAGVSGEISIRTGNTAGTSSGLSGEISIKTGSSVGSPTGKINIQTGPATAAVLSGDVDIRTGTSNGGGSGKIKISSGSGVAGVSGNIEIESGTASTDRGFLRLNTRGMQVQESAVGPADANTGGLFVSDGSGTLPGGSTPVANALYYLGHPARNERLDLPTLDRHHLRLPEAAAATEEYIGWAGFACRLTKVKALMATPNTVGNYTLAISNQAGNTVLAAASYDMNSLIAGTVTNVALTAVLADLDFLSDDKWTITLVSSAPGFNGQGIYLDLTFELT